MKHAQVLGKEFCNVPDLAGLWSMVLSAHHRDPCELMFGFGGLCWEIAILGLTIFSKSHMASCFFGLSSSGRMIIWLWIFGLSLGFLC